MSRVSRHTLIALVVAGLVAPVLLLVGGTAPARAADPVRPTEDIYTAPEATPVCRGGVCVHYAQDGTNDVPTEDDGAGGAWKGTAGNGVPDYVDLISGALVPKVAKVLTDAGYRAPVGDGAKGGGTDQLDIYLAELDDVDGGAYCRAEGSSNAPTAGFCVLDNDYTPAEYGTRLSPAANLSLDVAHHYAFFVQWAYPDWWRWLDTFGAWLEDEIYPNLNRNRALLAHSPLTQPGTSMSDMYGSTRSQELGRWIFLRFLGERFPATSGSLPVLVRDLLEHGDDALTARGTSMLEEFTTFTTWNRNPAAFYAEGASYPTAPLAKNVMLNGTTVPTTTIKGHGQEWTSFSYRFRPSSNLRGAWRIRIDARSDSGTESSGKALVATFKAKGRPAATRVIAADEYDSLDAGITLAFTTSVEWVEMRVVTGAVYESSDLQLGDPTITVKARVTRG